MQSKRFQSSTNCLSARRYQRISKTPTILPRLPISFRASRVRRADCVRPFAQRGPAQLHKPSVGNNGGNGTRSGVITEEVGAPAVHTDERFKWIKAWYPVGVVAALPKDRPTAVRLLGQALVVWLDVEGKWRCFRDLCPHRLAPLSEGRIEGEGLVCSYHGWKFNGEGKCIRIPQADDEKSLATATASRRSCVASHPCEARDGLVWVWAEDGPEAETEAAATPKALIPKMATGEVVQFTPWYMRELPYGADVLCENVIDPAHVPWSHHGIQGDRNNIKPFKMQPAKDIDPQRGFAVHSEMVGEPPKKGARPSYDLTFQPPSLIRYQYNTGGELVSHAVPTDPGRSKIFFTLVVPKARASGVLKLVLGVMTSKWLLWRDHITRANVLDGDNCFLHLQDRELQRRSGDWSRSYFMPASLDYGVKALRTWLGELAEPVPWAPGALPPPENLSRQQMLNRYEQHTKHCPECRKAHKVFGVLQWLGGIVAGLTLVAAAYALGAGQNFTPKQLIRPGLLVALSAFVAAKARTWRQQLVFQDYVHAEH